MADMDHGFKLAQDQQQMLIEQEAWASDPTVNPKVLQIIQQIHDLYAHAFVAVGFTKDQTATIFPGARGGARPQDGGSGSNKQPPPNNG